jgi:hypothetical protein
MGISFGKKKKKGKSSLLFSLKQLSLSEVSLYMSPERQHSPLNKVS